MNLVISIINNFIDFSKKNNIYDSKTFLEILNLINDFYKKKTLFYRNEIISILENKEYVIVDTQTKNEFKNFKNKIIDELNKNSEILDEDPLPFYVSDNRNYSIFS